MAAFAVALLMSVVSISMVDMHLHSLLRHEGPVEIQQSGRPVRVRLYANGRHLRNSIVMVCLWCEKFSYFLVSSEAMLVFVE